MNRVSRGKAVGVQPLNQVVNRQLVQDLLAQFRQQDAPAFLLEAFAPLLDDQVAEKAYVVLYECKRKMDSAG